MKLSSNHTRLPLQAIAVIILLLAMGVAVYFFLPPKVKSYELKVDNEKIQVRIVKISDTRYVLQAYFKEKKSEWPVHYSIFQIDTGDVNSDGATELIVGGVMPAANFVLPERRLFIYDIRKAELAPIGGAIVFDRPLVSFKAVYEDGIKIRTVEEEINGGYLVGVYEWKGAGLKLDKYLRRNISKDEALQGLNE